jgi:hypothetical protein
MWPVAIFEPFEVMLTGGGDMKGSWRAICKFMIV